MEKSLISMKLTMKEAQLINPEDTQIVSKIDSVIKVVKDTTIVPFGTIKVKGIIKTPNHHKCVNVVVDDLPESQHCKDVVIIEIDSSFETWIKQKISITTKFIL